MLTMDRYPGKEVEYLDFVIVEDEDDLETALMRIKGVYSHLNSGMPWK
jgi:hypothetical protein